MSTKADQPGCNTYVQILKSTALIGGASVINVAFSLVRNKVVAVLLGPTGFGLMSLYNLVVEMTHGLTGSGIQGSGVRQVAEATHSDDVDKANRTVAALNRLSIIIGLAGAYFLLSLAEPISNLTFGSNEQSAGVALLALAVFFRSLSSGQMALLQGLHRVSDLARISVLASFFSTFASIILIYTFQEEGIVPSIVAAAAVSMFFSWRYSRKIGVYAPRVPLRQTWSEMIALVRLGAALVAVGLISTGAAYAIRIVILRQFGLEAAGLYQAAWTLGGLYVGFILQSMATDFYPRLTAAANDNAECNRLVNEQAHISMLMASPGILATLAFTPILVTLFFSAEFQAAVRVAQWVCLGMALRVVTWPLGFILLAKNAQKFLFWTELAAATIHIGSALLLSAAFGLDGAGAAFFALYVCHGFIVYGVVRRLSGFRWSLENWRAGAWFLSGAAGVFAGSLFLPFWPATGLGLIASIISGIYSFRILYSYLPPSLIPEPIRAWLAREFPVSEVKH